MKKNICFLMIVLWTSVFSGICFGQSVPLSDDMGRLDFVTIYNNKAREIKGNTYLDNVQFIKELNDANLYGTIIHVKGRDYKPYDAMMVETEKTTGKMILVGVRISNGDKLAIEEAYTVLAALGLDKEELEKAKMYMKAEFEGDITTAKVHCQSSHRSYQITLSYQNNVKLLMVTGWKSRWNYLN